MAVNTNKRIAVKWVRDKAKAAYEKADKCYICGTTAELELHHVYSITELLERWAAEKGYDISTDDGILAVREEFIETHYDELYKYVYTLCNKHHIALHSVYGKKPLFSSAMKQARWIDIQRDKLSGGSVKINLSETFFSDFI